MENKPTIKQVGRYNLNYRGTECRNCKHPLDLSDKYCPNCSQANSEKKLTLKDFFDEFFATLISYDSRLLKTLTALLLKPGKITKDYINGKRTTYTNPFRFLLSLAIVYFLIISYTNNLSFLDEYGNDANAEKTDAQKFNVLDINFDEDILEDYGVALDSIKNMESLATADSIQKKVKSIIKNKDSIVLANPTTAFQKTEKKGFWKRYFEKEKIFELAIENKKVKTFPEAISKYSLKDNFENESAFNTAQSFIAVESKPGTYLNYIISKLPFAVFFFVPLFTLVIWLVYIRKKYTYTDHLIFSFHNTSLLFILLIISFIIDSIFKVSSAGIFFLIFAFYLYKSMRKFYNQERFKTIVKYMFLNFVFIIMATVAASLFFVGGAVTYN